MFFIRWGGGGGRRAVTHRYLDSAFKYAFPELEAFFAQVEALVVEHRVLLADVPLHLPMASLRALLGPHGGAKGLKGKLQGCNARFAKHLDPALGLRPRVQAAWVARLEARWAGYAARCAECYGHTLEPSAGEVAAFARDAAPDAAAATR